MGPGGGASSPQTLVSAGVLGSRQHWLAGLPLKSQVFPTALTVGSAKLMGRSLSVRAKKKADSLRGAGWQARP